MWRQNILLFIDTDFKNENLTLVKSAHEKKL